MKKSFLFLCFLSLYFVGISQTLFTFGKEAVSKQEFENAYNKNKIIVERDKDEIREYLDLYIAFKLKVQVAKDMQLDTLSSLKNDLETFKSQIEEIYLKDGEMVDKLIDEAFERSQKDIHLIDHFIALPQGADSTLYLKAVEQLHSTLKSNPAKAQKPHNTSIQEVKTDVGYITAFTLPYKFENIIYNLKTGAISEPIRTVDGWHIFENAGERKAVGQIRVAQILISAPERFAKERSEAKKLADSLYNLLQNGADFATIAKEYSHDRTSYFNEGILPAFGVGKYEKRFEERAFSLQKDGEIIPPFETEFGYHILKRISAEPVPASKDNESYFQEIAQKVAKDDRMETAKEAFNKQAVALTGVKEKTVDKKDLWLLTDSSLLANRMITSGNVTEETALLQFNDQTVVTVSDWTLYLRNTTILLMGNLKAQYPALFEDFVQYAALNNYRKRLTEFNPEFKAQLEEFRDGNMLFEIMEREVWSKAVTDSIGLLDFYHQNKQKYAWAESADALIISCINETIAKKVAEDLKTGKSKESILEENESLVNIDSGRFELPQIPVENKEIISAHKITHPVVNEQDGSVIFAQILKLYPANEPRSFEEARGMVISDYQQVLEEKWLEKLHKLYPVKINKKTFNKLLK